MILLFVQQMVFNLTLKKKKKPLCNLSIYSKNKAIKN